MRTASCAAAGGTVRRAANDAEADALWRARRSISPSLGRIRPQRMNEDIVVPRSALPDVVREIRALGDASPFHLVQFGHIGDGNLHLNILKPEDMAKEDFFEKCQQVNKWVFEIVERYQGSVSAEHGVGMTKKPYLEYTRSAAEIAYLRGIKQVFDPKGVMNPGKIFD